MKIFKKRHLLKKNDVHNQKSEETVVEDKNIDNNQAFTTEDNSIEEKSLLDNELEQNFITNDEIVLVNEPIVSEETYFASKDSSDSIAEQSNENILIKDNGEVEVESSEDYLMEIAEEEQIDNLTEYQGDSQFDNAVIAKEEITDENTEDLNQNYEELLSESEILSKDTQEDIELNTIVENTQEDIELNTIVENNQENKEVDLTAENIQENEEFDSTAENSEYVNAASEESEEQSDSQSEEELSLDGAEEKERDSEEKKKKGTPAKLSKKARNIIIAVVVAIVVLAVSIVTPILVLNRGKIFVKQASDLLNTKGEIYVINNDVTFDGDLTLSKNINLKGNHLKVNGVLTLDLVHPNMNIGTLKKNVFVAEGNITAKKLIIKGAEAMNIANSIVADDMEITAKKIKFDSNLTIQNSLIISADNKLEDPIVFGGTVNFGQNAQGVTLTKSHVKFNQGVMANLIAEDSSIAVNETVGEVTLDSRSELRCNANVIADFETQELGTVQGGAMVYMSETSSADTVDGAKLYWTSQKNKNIREEKNIGETRYIITLQTPAYGNILVDGAKIYLKVDVVPSAERYSIKVDQDAEIIVTLTAEQKKNNILKTDVISDKLSKVGKHLVTIVAMGAEGESEFIKNSEPMQLQYEHDMQLEVPKNIAIAKNANKEYELSFDAVIFADYYEVIFDTVKLEKIPFDEGLVDGGKLIINLSKKDVLTDKFTVGKHIITVVAKSNNPNIQSSDSDFITFDIKDSHAAVNLSADFEKGILSWDSVPTALTYSVYIKRGDNYEKVVTLKNTEYQVTESGEYIVRVDGIANGYYTESVDSNIITISV